MYPTDVPHLHGFCTFSVPYLKIVVPHLKLGQLATLHPPKMDLKVYECIRSIKRRIEEEPTAPVSLVYDQQVKKFRRENASAGAVPIPIFDRVKSSLYEYRSSKQPPIPKILSSIIILHYLARTLMDQNFLFYYNYLASVLGFASPMALGANEH